MRALNDREAMQIVGVIGLVLGLALDVAGLVVGAIAMVLWAVLIME